MCLGIFGIKIGMSHIFSKKDHFFLPVTIIGLFNNYISKELNDNVLNSYFFNKNYYNFPFFKFFKFNIFKKNKVNLVYYNNFFFNNLFPINLFYLNQNLKIYAFSIGKGFSGTIKRYNFSSNNSTHGNSKSHNKVGSIGMCQDPGRVFPGKKMPGHLGNSLVFVKNSKLLKIDFEYNVIFLKGSIPGFEKSILYISLL